MNSIGGAVGGFFFALGCAGMVASSTFWVIAMRRARRGQSTERLVARMVWRPKSPGGRDLFVPPSGRPLDVADYVPAYLLGRRRAHRTDRE